MGLGQFFHDVNNYFENIKKFFDDVGNFFNHTIPDDIERVKHAYEDFICFMKGISSYIEDVINSFSSYLICGCLMILNLPFCFVWYILEFIGNLIYLPFSIFFYIFNLNNSIEKPIWNFINYIDTFVLSITGNSILHFPQTIVTKCYNCSTPIKPFPVLSDYIENKN
jgi:hypothetical protein